MNNHEMGARFIFRHILISFITFRSVVNYHIWPPETATRNEIGGLLGNPGMKRHEKVFQSDQDSCGILQFNIAAALNVTKSHWPKVIRFLKDIVAPNCPNT